MSLRPARPHAARQSSPPRSRARARAASLRFRDVRWSEPMATGAPQIRSSSSFSRTMWWSASVIADAERQLRDHRLQLGERILRAPMEADQIECEGNAARELRDELEVVVSVPAGLGRGDREHAEPPAARLERDDDQRARLHTHELLLARSRDLLQRPREGRLVDRLAAAEDLDDRDPPVRARRRRRRRSCRGAARCADRRGPGRHGRARCPRCARGRRGSRRRRAGRRAAARAAGAARSRASGSAAPSPRAGARAGRASLQPRAAPAPARSPMRGGSRSSARAALRGRSSGAARRGRGRICRAAARLARAGRGRARRSPPCA